MMVYYCQNPLANQSRTLVYGNRKCFSF